MPLKRLLILGGTGFIGSELAKLAHCCGVEVVLASRVKPPHSANQHLSFDLESPSILDDLRTLITRSLPSAVIDLAATGVSPSDRRLLDSTKGAHYAEALLLVTAEREIPRLVHVSSELISIGNTLDPYINLKIDVERVFQKSGLVDDVVSVIHLPRVIGRGEPRGRFVSDLLHALLTSKHAHIDEPHRIRNFIPVDSAASLLLSVAENGLPGARDGSTIQYSTYLESLGSIGQLAREVVLEFGFEAYVTESLEASQSDRWLHEVQANPVDRFIASGSDFSAITQMENYGKRSIQEVLRDQVEHQLRIS